MAGPEIGENGGLCANEFWDESSFDTYVRFFRMNPDELSIQGLKDHPTWEYRGAGANGFMARLLSLFDRLGLKRVKPLTKAEENLISRILDADDEILRAPLEREWHATHSSENSLTDALATVLVKQNFNLDALTTFDWAGSQGSAGAKIEMRVAVTILPGRQLMLSSLIAGLAYEGECFRPGQLGRDVRLFRLYFKPFGRALNGTYDALEAMPELERVPSPHG